MPVKPRVTPDQIAMYAGAMMNQSQIARVLGVTQQAISSLLKKPAYREAWERARGNTEYALMRKQIDVALDGDRTLLIWTGKQYLEQRDSPRELDIKSDVQVTYIARWAGNAALPEGGEVELIEGQVEEET